MFKGLLIAMALASVAAPAVAQGEGGVPLSVHRLDCGTVVVNDFDIFSDTRAYMGRTTRLASSCYLVRHGNSVMLWDTGLPTQLLGVTPGSEEAITATLDVSLVDQLARIGIGPDDVDHVGVSHYHFDHTGQAADFPAATLLIGAEDWKAVREERPGIPASALDPWRIGGATVKPVTGDHDVYGDGRVMLITLPGHTPGHYGLLIRLDSGPLLLSGDVAHFDANLETDGVPSFNTDRADSLASLDRFKRMAENLGATVVLQHEPDDVGIVPAISEQDRR